MKTKDRRTNYIRFISFEVPQEISVTFHPEVDLNDDATGRSRYERFYSVRNNYARKNLSLRRRSQEPSGVGCRVKLRRLTREHISKNISINVF